MCLQDTYGLAAAAHREKHGRANFIAAAFGILDTDVIRPLQCQHLHHINGRPRQGRRRAVRTGRKNLRVIAKQRHLTCARFTAQSAELEDELAFAHCAQSSRYPSGCKEILTLLHVQDGANDLDGVAETFLDLDIEPGVDAAVDVLDRKIENDE